MAEIDLDPNFKYLQANQQRALQGIQMGLEIAGRNQMMEMRRQEFNQQVAQDLIRANLQQAQADMYRQRVAEDVSESEAMRRDAPKISQYQSAYSQWLQNPDLPLPEPPQVESRQNKTLVNGLLSQADQYSTRARTMKELEATRKFKEEQFAKKLERARAVEQRFPDAKIISETNTGFVVDDAALAQFEPRLMQEQRNLELMKAMPPNQRGTLAQQLRDTGAYSEEMLQALEQSAGGTETIRQRNAKAAVEAMRNRNEQRGLNVDEDRLRKIEERILMTGNVQTMPVEQLSTMSSKFGVMELMDEFLDGVKQWQKEFPGRKFEENLGVIPRTQRDISAFLQKETDPAKIRAIELLVPLAFAQNTELKTTSGATVTPQEANRLAMAIGSQMDKNTITKLKAFRKSYEKGLRKDIAIYDGYYIPEFFQDFAVAKPKPGQETVNVLQFVNERTGMQPSGVQVPSGSPAGASNAPIINVDLIDAEMKRRGINPNQ